MPEVTCFTFWLPLFIYLISARFQDSERMTETPSHLEKWLKTV